MVLRVTPTPSRHLSRGLGNVPSARSDVEHRGGPTSFRERRLQLRESCAQSSENVIGPLDVLHRTGHDVRRYRRIVEQLDAAPSPRSEKG